MEEEMVEPMDTNEHAPPAKFMALGDEKDIVVKTYGVGDENGMVEVQVCTISPLGQPIPHNVINTVHEDNLHKLVWWSGGVMGEGRTVPTPTQINGRCGTLREDFR